MQVLKLPIKYIIIEYDSKLTHCWHREPTHATLIAIRSVELILEPKKLGNYKQSDGDSVLTNQIQ